MKNFFLFAVLFSVTNITAFAQSRIPEFEKARQIRLLHSTRAEVKKILAGYEYDKAEDQDSTQNFSTENADVKITFSGGNCSDDADATDVWNIAEGKVTEIEISLNEPIELKNFKFDFSDFQKEQKYSDVKDLYVYHNKNLGIAFDIDEDAVEKIRIFPSRSHYSSLCENEEAEITKEFYSTESYFGNSKLEDRIAETYCPVASVASLTLSTTELIICPADAKNEKCSNRMEISVTTEPNNPLGDPLIYHYNISGGEIIGEGSKVIWDLSGLAPGSYTITAGVDDGCGICGETKTQTVEVK